MAHEVRVVSLRNPETMKFQSDRHKEIFKKKKKYEGYTTRPSTEQIK